MRIITGKFKGRHFDIPKNFNARPTTDFAKENIFNVLNAYINFEEATALDLFAGTGSISIELISRGCAAVTCVENCREHYIFIRKCIEKIGTKQCFPIRNDVFRFIKSCKTKFDFIFADPPYSLNQLSSIPEIILQGELLKENAIFVLEHGKDYDFSNLKYFVEHRAYGSVNFSIFKKNI